MNRVSRLRVFAKHLDTLSLAIVNTMFKVVPYEKTAPTDGGARVMLLGAFGSTQTMAGDLAGLRKDHDSLTMPIVLMGPDSAEPEMEAAVTCLSANDWVVMPAGSVHLDRRVRHAHAWCVLVDGRRAMTARDALLRSILPEPFASTLAEGAAKPPPLIHPWAAILFSDIVDFTPLCAATPTATIIGILDSMFTAFDEHAQRLDVFKVETIGDAYMAAAFGGESAGADVERCMRQAQHMISSVRTLFAGRIRIRVGIHVGPASSGVVGETRPRYCFFGSTVNIASRMESSGEPDEVHLSKQATDELTKHSSAWAQGLRRNTSRRIKGIGKMDTFFWDGK